MRTYYIYWQRPSCYLPERDLECYEWYYYKWLPWELYGQYVGTETLYKQFYLKEYIKLSHRRKIEFVTSFEFNNSRVFHKTPDYYCKFIIIDDSGNIRNMFELIEHYRIKKQFRCYGRRWHTYQRKHYRELNYMRKKRISSREANEIWDEYGVRIKKVKHRYRNWNWQTIETSYSRCNKGKCWKEQSKRKRQWKGVEKYETDGL